MKKIKILWLSDGPLLTTGYATISRKLLGYLNERGYECHFLSHTGPHQTIMPGVTMEDGERLNFHVHGSSGAPYCQDLIMPKIQELRPDIFGVLLDTFMLYPWFLNLDFAPAKSLFYFPSDGGGGLKDGKLYKGIGCNMPLDCEKILKKVDMPISMSMFAKEQVKEIHNLDVKYIPHACESEIYKPLSLEEKIMIRRQQGLHGRFVIGVVARNQGRKMLDRTLEAFALAKDRMPNAILMLHVDKTDPAGYFNFDAKIAQLHLENRVVFTGTKYYKGFDYKRMNEIYNLMDVFFLGTSGEGFGVPIIEAMSCEIPVLATDYTTTWELVERNEAGESIAREAELLGNWNVGRAMMSIKDGADKMVKFYNNPQLCKTYGKNGRVAVLRDYTWSNVANQWDALLRSMIK